MSDGGAALGQSAADSTRAAKARFVQASPERLVTFLEAQAGIARVELLDFQPVTDGAGASNGIALFRAAYELDGGYQDHDLVLRYMPGVQLLRQKSYADEFATVLAVQQAGLPVPKPLWLDADGSLLGFPGYVMERVDGTSPEAGMFISGLLADASPAGRKAMMLAAAGFHGRLRRTAIGPDRVPHLVHRGAGDTPVQRELDWWISEAQMAAAIGDPKLQYVERLRDWLVENEPPLRPPTLVHGDAQIANVMFKDGRIAAVVDWELSYLGHNEADLALILFLTEAHKAQAPGLDGVPTSIELIERYETEAAGKVEHLEFFVLLNFVKVLAIYLMLGDNMANLDEVWDYHVHLVDRALADAGAATKGDLSRGV
jgi:aminoglycoside phosphotransferase (APT) family kinase protein